MISDQNFANVKSGIISYKNIKSIYNESLKTSIITKLKTMLGISSYTRGERLSLTVDQTLKESWHICWARLYNYNLPEEKFQEFIMELNVELFILNSKNEERELAFSILNDLYLTFVRNHVRKIIENGKNYDSAVLSQMKVYEKSSEIAEKTILNFIDNLDRYSPYKSGFKTWMCRMATNIYLNGEKKTTEKTDYSLNRDTDESISSDEMLDLIPDTGPSPQALYEKETEEKSILEYLFKSSSYPWQIVSVALMSLNYTPQEIVRLVSGLTLYSVFDLVVEKYGKASLRSKIELDDFFMPLKQSMDKNLREIIPSRDSKTLTKLSELLDQKCGSIQFEAFLSGSPAKNVSEWVKRSIVRLRKEIGESEIFDRTC